jgi:hypothetical protein
MGNDLMGAILTYHWFNLLPDKQRAIKISKCCKIIRNKTKDKEVYETCRTIINATSAGNYEGVLKAVKLSEISVFGR